MAGIKHRWLVIVDDLKLKIDSSPFLSTLAAPFRLTLKVFSSFFEWFAAWIYTRQYTQLVPGTIAIILAVPLLVCLIRIPFHNNLQKAKHYRAIASEALARGDTEVADLYSKKLVQLGGVDSQFEYQRAIKLSNDEKFEEAFLIMQKIAPHEGVGFIPAHVWIADAIMWKLVSVPASDEEALIEHHLTTARRLYPEEPIVLQSLADFYKKTGKTEKALDTLSRINTFKLSPAQKVRSASLFSDLGAFKQSEEISKKAEEELFPNADNITREIYGLRASNYELQERYLEAVRSFHEGAIALNDAKLFETAGEAATYYLDHLSLDQDRMEQWLSIAEFSLKNDLLSEGAQSRVVQNVLNRKLHDKVDAIFVEAFDRGALSVHILEQFAEIYIRTGNYKRAKDMYRKVLNRHAKSKVSANNLAWLLSNSRPTNFDEALSLANTAVELDPDNSYYRETRGQIYVKKEMWEQAIADLKQAVNGLPNEPSIHFALAKCYEKLGDTELASIYQQQGKALGKI